MHFEDGTLYTYFGTSPATKEVNIGWLDPAHEYRRGAVSPEVLERLAWLCAYGRVNLTRGIHSCGFCPPDAYKNDAECYLIVDGGRELHGLGSSEIRVPGVEAIFAAPNLILHYMLHHDYLPPRDFVTSAEGLTEHLARSRWRVAFLTWDEVKVLRR